MSITKLLASSNYCIYNKQIARELGLESSIMLSELCSEHDYWEAHGQLNDGWFYSTVENVEEATTLTKYQQSVAIKKLEEEGLLKKQVRGIPAKRYFQLDVQKLETQLVKYLTTSSQKLENQKSKNQTEIIINNNNNKNINTSSKEEAESEKDKSKNDIPFPNICSSQKMNENTSIQGPVQPAQKEVSDFSKNYQVLMNYINSTPYAEELTQWFKHLGNGKVTLGQLKLKIEDIKKNVSSDAEVNESIHNAFINGWMGFFPVKKRQENKTTITNSETIHSTILQPVQVNMNQVW